MFGRVEAAWVVRERRQNSSVKREATLLMDIPFPLIPAFSQRDEGGAALELESIEKDVGPFRAGGRATVRPYQIVQTKKALY